VNRRKFLIGRPVLIASHASPAYRGKVGEVISVIGHVATVRFKTPRRAEDVAFPLQGLRLIPRPEKPKPPRSFLSVLIPAAARAAISR
jgi:hypothetical protein